MANLKCKMCGGELNIIENSTICECEYCGSKQTIPFVDNEKKISLYERANRLRYNCEFDKAYSLYETIIADFPEEAEAYWGILLCKYGIEYVDDPVTGKKVPTCHRSSFESIMEDKDFEFVMENAEGEARQLYREQAKEIEGIRENIIEVSGKEEPYDIFICYKETAEDGQRTIDSVIAQDVYESLINKGYKVFFSRITLEDKLGQEYEPYIFAALNSAKIMLVFGTTYNYFNAVWVKNEWSRFLKLMEKDRNRHLIPCYKDIDAYDIPKEFARLQGQDMGKIGAIQDLLRGIDKILNADDVRRDAYNNESLSGMSGNRLDADVSDNKSLSVLIDRGYQNLEDENWEKAYSIFENVLNQNNKCSQAFLGELLAEKRCKNIEQYKELLISQINNHTTEQISACVPNSEIIDTYVKKYEIPGYFDKKDIMEKCSFELTYKSDLKGMHRQKELIINQMENEKLFQRAKQYASNEESITLGLFVSAVEKEIDRTISTKLEKEKEKRNLIIVSYNEFIKSVDIELSKIHENSLKEKEANDQKIKKMLFKGSIAVVIVFAITLLTPTVIKPFFNNNMAYYQAKQHLSKGDYDEAIELFNALGNYKASMELSLEAQYKKANSLYNQGKYLEASNLFKQLIDYKDSSNLKNEADKTLLKLGEIGDIVLFGRYEQDRDNSNGNEDIEWVVLDKNDKAIFVVSKYALDYKPYNTILKAFTTWEHSTIREWLNGTFLMTTFSSYEQTLIMSTALDNFVNERFKTNGGNNTIDKVFLLSIDEVNKYQSFERNRKTTLFDGTKVFWWLRSPGDSNYAAVFVRSDGTVGDRGLGVSREDVAVRPAMWIDISDL